MTMRETSYGNQPKRTDLDRRIVVEVRNLRVDLPRGGEDIVADIDFEIAAGEVLGLVGESGSGKTTVSMALLGFARGGAKIADGSVTIDGHELLGRTERELRSLRGRVVSYVPQDPAAALNPALRIKRQVTETVEAHDKAVSDTEMDDRVAQIMESVGLPHDDEFLRRFPHQLSGGQQQRVCIAMAVALQPAMIVLDEPTTGLDVATQATILATVRKLCVEQSIAALYVTHDLSVVADIADRVMVMYAGRVVESSDADLLFAAPTHPYSSALLRAVPDVRVRTHLVAIPGEAARPGHRPGGCDYHPRCAHAVASCATDVPALSKLDTSRTVRCFAPLTEPVKAPVLPPPMVNTDGPVVLHVADVEARYGRTRVLRGVNFDLHANECLALVGESGSGKSTLARSLIGLHDQQSGIIEFDGRLLHPGARRRSKDDRRRIQYIFQSPHNSLNPRRNVGDIVSLAHRMFAQGSRRSSAAAVGEALERVGLSPAMMPAFPDELSGGERQRVAIARALIVEPEVLICDEITSALDVSVQAAIVDLLNGLKEERGLSMLFVTHDLALVRNIADRVMVLDGGSVVEIGATAGVLDTPEHDYTRQLVSHTLSVSAG